MRGRLRRELPRRARTVRKVICQPQPGRAVNGRCHPAAGAHLNQLRVGGNDCGGCGGITHHLRLLQPVNIELNRNGAHLP